MPNNLLSEWKSGVDLCQELKLGDLIEHWMVYTGVEWGRHQVIHYSTDGETGGPKKSLAKFTSASSTHIRKDEFLEVVGQDKCRINNELDGSHEPYPPHVIVERAESKLGEGSYNLLLNNCEHFVNWCRYGNHYSAQGDVVFKCIDSALREVKKFTEASLQAVEEFFNSHRNFFD